VLAEGDENGDADTGDVECQEGGYGSVGTGMEVEDGCQKKALQQSEATKE